MARTLTSVSPNPFPSDGNTIVHVYGTGFEIGDLIKWRFGTWSASDFVSDTELTIDSDPMPPDTVFTVQVAAGDFSELATGSVEVTATDAPPPPPELTATEISPAQGILTGGTYVEITGTGFLQDDIEVYITNSGIWVPAEFISETLISFVTEAGTEGSSPILIRRLSDVTEITLTTEFEYKVSSPYIPSPLGRDGDYYSDMTDPNVPIVYGPRTDGDWGDPL